MTPPTRAPLDDLPDNNPPDMPEEIWAWENYSRFWRPRHLAHADFMTLYTRADLIPARPGIGYETAVNIAIEAFEKLARLGNGNCYGNSNGNVMAQDALRDIRATLPQPPKQETEG